MLLSQPAMAVMGLHSSILTFGKGTHTMADPHGSGKTAISSPVVRDMPGSYASSSAGYCSSGPSIIKFNVGQGLGTMADPHGPGKTAINAPVVGALPAFKFDASERGATTISDNAAGGGTIPNPHGPGTANVSGPEGL